MIIFASDRVPPNMKCARRAYLPSTSPLAGLFWLTNSTAFASETPASGESSYFSLKKSLVRPRISSFSTKKAGILYFPSARNSWSPRVITSATQSRDKGKIDARCSATSQASMKPFLEMAMDWLRGLSSRPRKASSPGEPKMTTGATASC